MKVRGKKLLAAMLSLAMVLSMFVVPASAVTYEKEWDFSDSTLQSSITTIQGGTGTLDGLEIDATQGKFGPNGSWPQFNTGAIIKVPVSVPDGQVAYVTINAYSAGACTVDGKANTKGQEKEEFRCSGADGYVTIVSTANDYFGFCQ